MPEPNICSRPLSQKAYTVRSCNPPMNEKLLKLLTKAGWDSGFQLAFANEENKELERQLEEKQKRILSLTTILRNDTDHVEELKKHFSRVEYDIYVTQNLISAKRSEVMSEKNAACFAQRVSHRVTVENKTALEQTKDYQERNCAKLKNIERHRQTIEEITKLIEFSGKALATWKEKTERGEQDLLGIKEFKNVDSAQELELENRHVELGSRNKELRSILNTMAMTTNKLQEQFSRLGTEFRTEHRQRKELIQMWNNSINAMKRRDKDMASIGEEYYALREFTRQLDQSIKEREVTLQEEIQNGKQVHFLTHQADRQILECRDKLTNIQDDHELINDQRSSSRVEVERVSNHLKNVEFSIQKINEQFEEVRQKAARTEAENIVLTSRLQEVGAEGQNGGQILSQLEVMLDKHKEKCQQTYGQLKNFRQFIWERYTDKMELEQELQLRDKRIHKCQANIGFYLSRNMKNDELITQQRNSHFHVELQVSQLHARISKLTNETISHDTVDLYNKIHRLKETHEEVLHDRAFIQREIEHDNVAMTRIERAITNGKEANKSYDTLLRHLETECRIINKYWKDMDTQVKDKSVAVSLQKVVLKRVLQQQTQEQESICTLTQHRFTVEGALKERKVEIDTHITLNQSLLKSLKEATGTLRLYIADILKHISTQKCRFEEISDVLSIVNENRGTSGGGGGATQQFPSFSERMMAVIRERELLTEESKMWGIRVKEAEDELVGLTNTVQLLNTANCAFKANLAPAEPNSPEYERMKELEEAEKFALLRRHHAKKIRLRLRDKSDETVAHITVIKQQIRNLSFVANAKMRMASMLSNEMIVQRDKIARSTTLCQKLLQDLKGLMPLNMLELIEKDLRFRFLNEKLEFAVVMVEKLLTIFPGAQDNVLQFMDEVDLLRPFKTRISQVGQKGHKNDSRHAHHFNTDTYFNFVNELHRRELMTVPPSTSASMVLRKSVTAKFPTIS